jgi:5'-nucleotidase
MTRILLTNDDGIDSPALTPFARALRRLGSVTIVVPSRERSWVGKAITRHDPLTVETNLRDGLTISAVDGYPADCAQIGMHVGPEGVPDLVVSGINVGYNHGQAFLMSSGTVGAAIEAALGGVPAVAVSAGIIGDWPTWSAHAWSEAALPMWERLSIVAVDLIEVLLAYGFPAGAQVLSINLPANATEETERRITRLARSAYDQLFAEQGDGTYRHAVENHRIRGEGSGTDIEAAHDGAIAITPLCLPATGAIPDDLVNEWGAVRGAGPVEER